MREAQERTAVRVHLEDERPVARTAVVNSELNAGLDAKHVHAIDLRRGNIER